LEHESGVDPSSMALPWDVPLPIFRWRKAGNLFMEALLT
jgi:hypothetical protein